MATISYGTITVTDITDITDVYLEYCMTVAGLSATQVKNKTTWTSPEITWGTTYPQWISGYEIWIRQATEKEGLSIEYGTPYLDTAVNQINLSIGSINTQLQNKLKYFWNNLDNNNYPKGTYMASGIENVTFNYESASTYGYNTHYSNGIKLRYNAIDLTTLLADGLSLYYPIVNNNNVIVNSGLGAKFTANSLTFYQPPIISGNTVTTGSEAAILNANGLVLSKGGIEAGVKNTSDYIYVWSNDDATNHTLNINSSGNQSDWRIVAGNKFGVNKAGILYASDAHIEGTIDASSGTIGGFTIGETDLYNELIIIDVDGHKTDKSVLMSIGKVLDKDIGGLVYNEDDDEHAEWAFAAGDKFGVTTTGAVYATDLYVSPNEENNNDLISVEDALFNLNSTLTILDNELTINEYQLSEDTIVDFNKDYYEHEVGYQIVNNPTGNPFENEYYEKSGNLYILSEDTVVDDTKTYYTYIDIYTIVTEPVGNPNENDYYEHLMGTIPYLEATLKAEIQQNSINIQLIQNYLTPFQTNDTFKIISLASGITFCEQTLSTAETVLQLSLGNNYNILITPDGIALRQNTNMIGLFNSEGLFTENTYIESQTLMGDFIWDSSQTGKLILRYNG